MIASGNRRIALSKVSGYGNKRLPKLKQAAELFEEIINNELFDYEVLQFRGVLRRGFLEAGGLSNADVLETYLEGGVARKRGKRTTLPLTLHLVDDEGAGVYGFVRSDGPTIYTYRDFFDDKPISWMAAHLAHEYAHVVGFTHRKYPKLLRRRTVPYGIGDIVYGLAQTYKFTP